MLRGQPSLRSGVRKKKSPPAFCRIFVKVPSIKNPTQSFLHFCIIVRSECGVEAKPNRSSGIRDGFFELRHGHTHTKKKRTFSRILVEICGSVIVGIGPRVSSHLPKIRKCTGNEGLRNVVKTVLCTPSSCEYAVLAIKRPEPPPPPQIAKLGVGVTPSCIVSAKRSLLPSIWADHIAGAVLPLAGVNISKTWSGKCSVRLTSPTRKPREPPASNQCFEFSYTLSCVSAHVRIHARATASAWDRSSSSSWRDFRCTGYVMS